MGYVRRNVHMSYVRIHTSMVSYFRSGRSRLGARGIYPSSHFFLPPIVHLLGSQYMHIFALTLNTFELRKGKFGGSDFQREVLEFQA